MTWYKKCQHKPVIIYGKISGMVYVSLPHGIDPFIHPQGPHDVTRLWRHPGCQWPACRDLKVELKMISRNLDLGWLQNVEYLNLKKLVCFLVVPHVWAILSLYQEAVEKRTPSKIQLSAPLLIAAQIRFDTSLHQEFGRATGFFVFFWQSQFGLEVPMSGVHCASHFQAGWSSRLSLK